MSLTPCRRCRRHTRTGAACPFCGAVVPTIAARGALGVLAVAIVVAPDAARADTAPPPASAPRDFDSERNVHPLYGLPERITRRENAIQADLGLGVIGIGYERILSDHVAVQLSVHTFGTWWGPTFDLPYFKGFGGELRPTFFVTAHAPAGVYVAPFFRLEGVSATEHGATGHGAGWSAGAFVGYSFVFSHGFNLRIGGGPQYMSYGVDTGLEQVKWKRFYPALDLVVGYAF